MHRFSNTRFAAIATLLFVSLGAAQQIDQQKANLSVNLTGSWRQQDGPRALLKITQVGKKVEAVKIEGDPTSVPLGKVSFRGTFDSNPFTVQWQFAEPGYQNPFWQPVKIEVENSNTFTTSLNNTVWKREPPQ
jgi:hypothetical protein